MGGFTGVKWSIKNVYVSSLVHKNNNNKEQTNEQTEQVPCKWINKTIVPSSAPHRHSTCRPHTLCDPEDVIILH